MIDAAFDEVLPTMTVLVPSYREELATIRKTLLSAALQEYPYLRVVLLLDDPPNPIEASHLANLQAARELPAQLQAWLAEPRTRFERTLEGYETSSPQEYGTRRQIRHLAAQFRWAQRWLDDQIAAEDRHDHVDVFFAEEVLGGLSADFGEVADALFEASNTAAEISRDRMLQLHRRLAWTFRAELTWFERKMFVSLSHDANKAMNLNSYLGLMGRTFDPVSTSNGTILRPAGNTGSIAIPDSDFVLTLDADSVLLPEYCLRLVYLMQQPENARLAVAQTPYSAFPGSSTRLERLAGATTDLQHIVHQGMSYHDAAFWVGANAVIRKSALEDIVEVERNGAFEIRRYVQDRTVIEDTESSVDLTRKGWRLLNYPERLSYSSTPPDFGSLAIQRRRWANGGLLILPKLIGNARARAARGDHGSAIQTMLKINYMAATCWSSIGLLVLLGYPFDDKLLSPLVLLAALPYFVAMASDLRRCGYKRTDVLRIYAFNLILLPVNLAGVLKSLQQAVTGKKIPFARTPKVADRTATPALFALSPFVIIGYSLWTYWRSMDSGHWGNAAFAALNTLAALYAVVAFVGVRNAIVDIGLGFVEHLYVTETPAVPASSRRRRAENATTPASWEEILFRGAAATATGQHPSGGGGQFRILAVPPEPSVERLVEPSLERSVERSVEQEDEGEIAELASRSVPAPPSRGQRHRSGGRPSRTPTVKSAAGGGSTRSRSGTTDQRGTDGARGRSGAVGPAARSLGSRSAPARGDGIERRRAGT
ncbi:glycosyltransferase family 2 protein [Jatrophihabitans sp.]|uniref:glycosyltransferase family 2 protein n=1 Tax=Jatrophihabitans sp. TaxID=1932789 RepID=UPI0030C67ABF